MVVKISTTRPYFFPSPGLDTHQVNVCFLTGRVKIFGGYSKHNI